MKECVTLFNPVPVRLYLHVFLCVFVQSTHAPHHKASTLHPTPACETFATPHTPPTIPKNPSQSQKQQLGKPLNCMSVARQPGAAGLVAAVGGAQMLKIVSISPHGLVEKTNLRLTNKVTSEVNFSILDVEW